MAKGTPYARFRLAAGLWERLDVAARSVGSNRAEILRRLVLWYLRYPGAELPERPEAEEEPEA